MQRLLLIAFWLFAIPAQGEVYLSPFDTASFESGTAFISRAVNERLVGRGCVDIRPDKTAQDGFAVCESDALPTNRTGVLSLGSTRTSVLSAKIKTDTTTASKVTMDGVVTAEDAIKKLVIPTLQRPRSGEYEIILGKRPPIKTVATWENDVYYKGRWVAAKEWGLAFARNTWANVGASIAHATTLATENWTGCADNGSLTCVHTWVDKVGSGLGIVSNTASASGVQNNSVYAQATLATTDHEFSATVISCGTGGAGTNTTCSVLGRTTDDATATFYRVVATRRNAGELFDWSIVETVANTSTILDTNTTDPVPPTDIMAIRMIGTTISARVNGVEILSLTDGTITTGLFGGLRCFSDSASGTCQFDNFNGQDIAVAAATRNHAVVIVP